MVRVRKIVGIVSILIILCTLCGCAMIGSNVNSLNGSITGNTYECQFYSNTGEKFMTLEGQKIDINENIVTEPSWSSEGGWGYVKTLSSVITITVDGSEMESCGTTVLFIEKGLNPDVDFTTPDIYSEAHGFGDNTYIANIVNRYRNAFGKPRVIVIQSQLGNPIAAFSGNSIYYEVCQDLPKTTKLMVDGKALYIHRANFQIIDKDLIIDTNR